MFLHAPLQTAQSDLDKLEEEVAVLREENDTFYHALEMSAQHSQKNSGFFQQSSHSGTKRPGTPPSGLRNHHGSHNAYSNSNNGTNNNKRLFFNQNHNSARVLMPANDWKDLFNASSSSTSVPMPPPPMSTDDEDEPVAVAEEKRHQVQEVWRDNKQREHSQKPQNEQNKDTVDHITDQPRSSVDILLGRPVLPHNARHKPHRHSPPHKPESKVSEERKAQDEVEDEEDDEEDLLALLDGPSTPPSTSIATALSTSRQPLQHRPPQVSSSAHPHHEPLLYLDAQQPLDILDLQASRPRNAANTPAVSGEDKHAKPSVHSTANTAPNSLSPTAGAQTRNNNRTNSDISSANTSANSSVHSSTGVSMVDRMEEQDQPLVFFDDHNDDSDDYNGDDRADKDEKTPPARPYQQTQQPPQSRQRSEVSKDVHLEDEEAMWEGLSDDDLPPRDEHEAEGDTEEVGEDDDFVLSIELAPQVHGDIVITRHTEPMVNPQTFQCFNTRRALRLLFLTSFEAINL